MQLFHYFNLIRRYRYIDWYLHTVHW